MAGPSQTPNGTPAPPASLKKSTSSSKNQTSIAGFFKKSASQDCTKGIPRPNGVVRPVNGLAKLNGVTGSTRGSSQSLTPAPSSDAAEELYNDHTHIKSVKLNRNDASNSLPSPITPASAASLNEQVDDTVPGGFCSPSRKVCLRTCFMHYIS